MRTNIEFFNLSKMNPEPLLDSYYAKDKVVIPESKEEQNDLTRNNSRLIDLITTFSTLYKMYNKDATDEIVQKIVYDVTTILDSTESINYSAFVQFFMVHNYTYSLYEKLSIKEKMQLVYEMLKKYVIERHDLYLSHGYSNIVLQVLCDNYSHKRNSKTGIEKVLAILKEVHEFDRLTNAYDFKIRDDYYFLPDKGDNKTFEYFLSMLDLKMESRQIEQNKLPDIVFKHNDHYYICELKTMKEGGGGQHKQIVEVAHFIRFSEENPNVHYITFLDCNYSNIIFNDASPKVIAQRKDIGDALKNNPNNYFLNTHGFTEFVREIFE